MEPTAVALPERVWSTVAHAGDRGTAWAAALPGVVAELERRWSIEIGDVLDGGTAAFVATARTADGTDAVLKVGGLIDGFAEQVATLIAADGRGYARVLTADVDVSAVLLERLGPSLDDVALPVEQQLGILCDTLRAAWRPAPPGVPAFDKAGELAALIERLWTSLGEPCPEHVVARALECVARRAAAAATVSAVVVHGDPHPANALAVPSPRPGAETGFVFVDPDGFVGDPAYDCGVLLREWNDELLTSADPVGTVAGWCALVAARAGVDHVAIADWAFAERVSSGLFVLDHGDEAYGRAFLTTAELLTPKRC